jgi:hypothetical protein
MTYDADRVERCSRWIVCAVWLSSCSPSPPEGALLCDADAACPDGWVCRADGRCWTTRADAGVRDAGAALDASSDAGIDSGNDGGSPDASCATVSERSEPVEADSMVSRSQPIQMFGTTHVMNVSVGPMLFHFGSALDLVLATQVRLVVHGAVCADDCDPGHRCDEAPFRVPGTLELYQLSRRFDENTVTMSQAAAGERWMIDRGGADRGPLLATALYGEDDATVVFVVDPAALAGTPTFSFLVDRPAGATNVFVARTIETAGGDAVCAGEMPSATLVVEACDP